MNRAVNIVRQLKNIVANDGKTIYENAFITTDIRNAFFKFLLVENNNFELDDLYNRCVILSLL